MAKIDVYTSEMSSLSSRLKKISSVIQNAEAVVGKVQSSLDFQVAAKADIAGGLSRTRKQLRGQQEKVTNLSQLTSLSVSEFRTADSKMDKSANNILGKIAAPMAGMVLGVKQLFVGASVSKHKSISSIFMPAGTIITVTGIRELIRRLAQIVNGSKGNGGISSAVDGIIGGAASGTGTAQQPQITVPKVENVAPKPQVVNTGSSSQNAANAGMTYYLQGKNADHWKVYYEKTKTDYSYKGSKACAICCTAMIASHFGANLSPSELIAANGGDASWDGTGVQNLMGKNGLQKTRISPQDGTLEKKVKALDDYLEKYLSDPANNAPPMVSMPSDTSSSHFVLVLGKDQNGDYIIVDPANNNRTTLKIAAQKNGKTYGKDSGYECPIKGVFTWAKK